MLKATDNFLIWGIVWMPDNGGGVLIYVNGHLTEHVWYVVQTI